MKKFVFVVLLFGMISSCKKEKIQEGQPQLVSNLRYYYSTPLQPIKTAKVYEAAVPGTISYKIYKGSNFVLGEDVSLSINGPDCIITAINTSNANYDLITGTTSLGSAHVGDYISDRTTYLTVMSGMNVKVQVAAVPTTLCDGESYVASIVDLPGIGNQYSIVQVQNSFLITMQMIDPTVETKIRTEVNNYLRAVDKYLSSLSTPNPSPVPQWTNYVLYDWGQSPGIATYSGKFIIRRTGTNKFALYIAEPDYPISPCTIIVED